MRKKKCAKTKDKLFEYLRDWLTSEEKGEIEEHLKICQDCQSERSGLKDILTALDKLEAPKISDDFTLRLMKRIAELEEERRRLPKFLQSILDKLSSFIPTPAYRLQPVAIVALLLILCVGSFFYWRGLPPGPERIPKKMEILLPGQGAGKPILIFSKDINTTLDQLKELVYSYKGELIKEYKTPIGLKLVVKIDKKVEEGFFQGLTKMGKIEKEKTGYKDKMGNIVLLLKESSYKEMEPSLE